MYASAVSICEGGILKERATSRWRATAAILLATVPLFSSGCEDIREKYELKRPPLHPALEAAPPWDPVVDGAAAKRAVEPAVARTGRSVDALRAPEYYPGGMGVMEVTPRDQDGSAGTRGPSVTLNFVDTSLREVVDAVLWETLGLNYVIDPRVSGSVTARTSGPIARADLLAVLENILALNDAAFIVNNGVYNVVPLEAAASIPKTVVTPGHHALGRGIGIHIIPVRHASAASLQEAASSIVSPGNQIAVDTARNLLIYTGPSQEANAIGDLVDALDVDVLAGLSFALIPVESSDAAEIAGELEGLFAEGVFGAMSGPVRFMPIRRLNAILIVATRPDYLRRLGTWVARLDRADTTATRNAFVYHVRNGKARDLADVLDGIFGANTRQSRRRRPDVVAPGLQSVRIEQTSLTGKEVSETSPPPDGIEDALAPFTDDLGPDAIQADDGIRFVPHDNKNAIVVMATAEEFRKIESVMRLLDEQPFQVLIEATIAEVTLNDNLEYGLQWFFEQGDVSGRFSSNALGAVTSVFPGFNLVLDTSDVKVVLRALSEVTDVEVISSPQLMVLDNQAARLQVGDQVPIATQTAVPTDVNVDDARIVNSISYFDTGVILVVTPRVTTDGQVTLETELEVSDAVDTESSSIDSPTIRKRTIQTTIAVQSGETVALGGLIRDEAEQGETGIPLLKDIPLLGHAFKTTGQDSRRRELLILITPRIVRDAAEARAVTNELRLRMSDLRRQLAAGG